MELEQNENAFDDITSAVSNFVDKYQNMQNEIATKDDRIRKLQLEIEKLDKISNENTKTKEEMDSKLSVLKEENSKYRAENERLQKLNQKLENKLAKSAEILNKIYQSISKR